MSAHVFCDIRGVARRRPICPGCRRAEQEGRQAETGLRTAQKWVRPLREALRERVRTRVVAELETIKPGKFKQSSKFQGVTPTDLSHVAFERGAIVTIVLRIIETNRA